MDTTLVRLGGKNDLTVLDIDDSGKVKLEDNDYHLEELYTINIKADELDYIEISSRNRDEIIKVTHEKDELWAVIFYDNCYDSYNLYFFSFEDGVLQLIEEMEMEDDDSYSFELYRKIRLV